MVSYAESDEIAALVKTASKIVIVQADNPDADSLASSLALEQILEPLGKEVFMYCGVDLPSYLHYLPGSDRVVTELPHKFDLSIIVDTSSEALLEQMRRRGERSWLTARPSLIIDHHATEPTIDFATVICNKQAVSTGEVIYELAQDIGWPLNKNAKELIAIAILSDSLGLTSENTTARSVHIIAELVEGGVKLSDIENARRETMRREAELIHYKGRLLERVEFHSDERIAALAIPWEEIEKYSPLYNPSMLVIDDMRLAKKTDMAICFKIYKGGKVTAKIRCNYKRPVAAQLAEHFGGGGHAYASGFKIQDGRSYEQIKQETIKVATELLSKLEIENEAT